MSKGDCFARSPWLLFPNEWVILVFQRDSTKQADLHPLYCWPCVFEFVLLFNMVCTETG